MLAAAARPPACVSSGAVMDGIGRCADERSALPVACRSRSTEDRRLHQRAARAKGSGVYNFDLCLYWLARGAFWVGRTRRRASRAFCLPAIHCRASVQVTAVVAANVGAHLDVAM
jgi:hypothetical protein